LKISFLFLTSLRQVLQERLSQQSRVQQLQQQERHRQQ
jgi:hypothetical protein